MKNFYCILTFVDMCYRCDWKKKMCLALLEQRYLSWHQSFHKVWIIWLDSCIPLTWSIDLSVEYVEHLLWHKWWKHWRKQLDEFPLPLTRLGCSGQRGQQLSRLSAFYPAWVKCTHPSQPLPCFLPGHPTVFCDHFFPPSLWPSVWDKFAVI